MLSSDIHLHLEKVQKLKGHREVEMEDSDFSDEELKLMEKEMKRLEGKLEKHREIRCFQQTSISTHLSGDRQGGRNSEDDDYEYEEEVSTESIHYKPRNWRQCIASSGEASQKTESIAFISPEEFAKAQQMAQLRDYVWTQSRFEVPIEMPLIEL